MVYNYTRPRGPLAATYNSPGPCYCLPPLMGRNSHDPRSTHGRAPSFHFGIKHGRLTDESGPGPCYMPPPQVTRTGRASVPTYSMASRSIEVPHLSTPGPGCYAPERSTPGCFQRSPAFTFGLMHRSRSVDCSPGPNAYHPWNTIGRKSIASGKLQAPSFSLKGRTKFGSPYEQLERTPGPCCYSMPDIGKVKSDSPKFSIGRKFKHDQLEVGPGPGSYGNEKNLAAFYRCPQYTFGIKHSQYACCFDLSN